MVENHEIGHYPGMPLGLIQSQVSLEEGYRRVRVKQDVAMKAERLEDGMLLYIKMNEETKTHKASLQAVNRLEVDCP